MIDLECDDSDLERSLRKFEEQVGAAGGWLSDGLTVVSEAGGIMVETRSDSAGSECMMSIPEDVLLPVDLVQWRLAGDDLCIESFGSGVSRERRQLFETSVEIYNLTSKIATHRDRCPGIALAHDSILLDDILNGRDRSAKGEDDPDQAVIRSFFHSRVFAFSYGMQPGDVLMPFIDFLNHHPQATGYQTVSARHPGRAVIASLNSKPYRDSQECLVRYGMYDAFDLFTTYAFVDRNCSYVSSVPLTIELEGLGDFPVASAEVLQGRFAKVPQLNKESPVLRHLIIPGRDDPHCMRRVLAQVIDGLRPGLQQDAQAAFVQEAERQVIAANVAYYKRLQTRVQATTVGRNREIYSLVDELAAGQLARLGDYMTMD